MFKDTVIISCLPVEQADLAPRGAFAIRVAIYAHNLDVEVCRVDDLSDADETVEALNSIFRCFGHEPELVDPDDFE